jgi:hypothetical protein
MSMFDEGAVEERWRETWARRVAAAEDDEEEDEEAIEEEAAAGREEVIVRLDARRSDKEAMRCWE